MITILFRLPSCIKRNPARPMGRRKILHLWVYLADPSQSTAGHFMHTSLQKYKYLGFQKKKSLVQLISVARTEHDSSSVLLWKCLFFFFGSSLERLPSQLILVQRIMMYWWKELIFKLPNLLRVRASCSSKLGALLKPLYPHWYHNKKLKYKQAKCREDFQELSI